MSISTTESLQHNVLSTQVRAKGLSTATFSSDALEFVFSSGADFLDKANSKTALFNELWTWTSE